jgi:UDP-N-acetylmuramoyl-tripeptide--D-alanyl-D-alanine ligase
MNLRYLFSMYSLSYPKVIIYMLQTSEYRTSPYLNWLWRTKDFSKVQYRKSLEPTNKAKMLLLLLSSGIGAEILAGIALIIFGSISFTDAAWCWPIGLALLLAYPLIWPHLIIIPLEFGRVVFVLPNQSRQIKAANKIFASHPGVKIAVAGSYGKTTMKELLYTVLSEGKRVVATPANKNVSSEHAKFASGLDGKEDILIIEYGEGAPGDVSRFASYTHPTYGIITGIAPAHLDRYKTLAAAAADIFSLAIYLKNRNVYVNGEAEAAKDFIKPSYTIYTQEGVGKWKVDKVEVSSKGLNFNLKQGRTTLHLHSSLLGRHQIGPLALCAVLALDLGLKKTQVERSVAKTEPFPHRMQPYELGGAWIIDDTYNGNIEGIRVGTELLKELSAKRKIYVTPGLVDQGEETAKVHSLMGKYIADAKPDLVVLMENSVTDYILEGLRKAGFKGEIQMVGDPLAFYTNLETFVAAGDLVLMQNDWPDNYA